ncbi:NADH-quinone oxidoreductase subunit C [Cellulomonas dongxiuzhuiae]|uniref:NADH-quinone oxidoreductase subunit C n=1 Tax=Cellulomonas dongxiuzhuiae TaxID=2819979 RepID=A0ABX8GI44_9CELL|nr:NADH-quinone oxidoreductase subunit C [Cellulomonas dongxiuzhuiae]MBO3094263.1 NADH-quinone oxidoreductase subunit C [Cellulomonas dongxiuzhuiae]QWC15311.1 NADH-quinone oxidoreductase subunit C [Cellulomonas dongxiuzhuiae]
MSDEGTQPEQDATPGEGTDPTTGTKPAAVSTPPEDATSPAADRPTEGTKPTAEKADASAAVKPGEPAPAGTQRTSAAALEAGSQNLPAGPDPTGPRTPLDIVDVRTGMFGVAGTGDTSGFGGLVRTVAMPGPSERPYGGWFDEVVDVLTEVLDESGTGFAHAVEAVVVDRGELTLEVAREHLVEVVQALRDDPDLRFELSLGVSGVHFPHDAGRELHAVYHVVSVTHGRRLRLEVAAPEGDPHIPSTVAVYPANDWHERETWDFFGIVFDGHPGLARIEMPDDWPGHPQRKDYPLGGIPVEYKGATIPPPDQRRSYS